MEMGEEGDKEEDGLSTDYQNFYSTSGAIKKEDEEAFERFCDYRVSTQTLNVVGLFTFLFSSYVYAMSLIDPKSYYLLAALVGFGYFIRNPLTFLAIYFRQRIRRGYPVPSFVKFIIAPWLSITLNLLSVYSSLALSLFLIARVLNGKCKSLDQYHVWSCNSEYDAHALPQELVMGLMFMPFVYSITFKTIRTLYVFLSWIVIVVGIIVAIAIGDAYQSIPIVVVYVPLSLLMLYEMHRQKVVLFLLLKKQQSLMDANKHLAEESQNELRFMIANMAHDLKTPLSAFMNGVETLTSLIRDVERTSSVPNIEQVKENLMNLQTVNNFMTMTVNRCIDYMKASKGIKLEPRLETINLQEVLSMPLNCMRDLQSRITIMQKPIPGSVCSHIITDLQWFQENLFCLISNAVKYSSHGSIRLSVTLTTVSHPRFKDSRRKNACLKVMKVDDCMRSDHLMGHENYTFLDRLVVKNSNVTQSPSGNYNHTTEDLEQGTEIGETCSENIGINTSRRLTERARRFFKGLSFKRQNTIKVFVSSPNDGTTELVAAANNEDLLLIEVEDTGIGLSDEVKETLFTPFKQAQRRAGGTGLGLYSLAKRVDALGGYYGVSNRRDGEQGSIFWFAIPYRPDASALSRGTPTAESRKTFTSSTSSVIPRSRSSSVGRPSSLVAALLSPSISFSKRVTLESRTDTNDNVSCVARRPSIPSVSPGKLRILLVDDSLTILKMTSNLLKRHGHVVDQEENGADALKALERSRSSGVPYDVALIDLNMPVMDGLEAMKRLRETERQLNAKSNGEVVYHQRVFAFSANSDAIALAEAMEAGADDFISKPFTIQTFNEKVDKWEVQDV